MLCFLIFADSVVRRIEGSGGDSVVLAEFGQVGDDRGVRCPKRRVPVS